MCRENARFEVAGGSVAAGGCGAVGNLPLGALDNNGCRCLPGDPCWPVESE